MRDAGKWALLIAVGGMCLGMGGCGTAPPPESALSTSAGSPFSASAAATSSPGAVPSTSSPATGASSPAGTVPAALRGHGRLAWVSSQGLVEVLDGTADRGYQWNPRGTPSNLSWSSNGKWLAYLLQQNGQTTPSLWMGTSQGNGHLVQGSSGKVLAVADYAWSPVANEVALESASGQLWLAVAGQVARQISPSSRRVAGPVAWSPDGSQIAYASTNQGRPGHGQLDVFTVAGQRTESLQRLANTGFLVADWLPGNTLLYWQDPYFSSSIAADGLWLYSDVLPGNHPRRLVQTLPYPEWISPASDGKTVAVVAGTLRETWVNKSVALCTVQTGQCHVTGEKSGAVHLDPALSAAGLAYVAAQNRGNVGGWSDCSSPAACQNRALLQHQAIKAFAAWQSSRSLWLASPSGSAPEAVPQAGAGIWDPTWDPSHSLLIYVRSNALWMFSPATRHATQITGTLAVPGGPAGQLGYYGHLAWNTEWTWNL